MTFYRSKDKSLDITMQPLTVDTVFSYGGVTAPAVLAGTKLPAEVAASIVWTLGGGIATLRDAQADLPGGGINLNWGNPFKSQHTILRLNGGSPAETSAALADNQITLGLGELAAADYGSANFKLEYLPFGFSAMDDFKLFDTKATEWIIRNGVNDTAQDGKTVFPNTASAVSPWDDDKTNGNGAVVFTAESLLINLTNLILRPVTAGIPVTGFDEGTYSGTVSWTTTDDGEPHSALFAPGTAYTAAVTLYPAAGGVFPASVPVTHTGANPAPGAFAHKAGAAPGTVSGTVKFDPTPGTPVSGLDLTLYLSPPAVGKTPAEAEELRPEPSQYTVAVEWKETAGGTILGDNDKFKAATAYTATVTLTAKPGYTFAPGTTFVYNGDKIDPVSNDGGSVTVSISGLDESKIPSPW